MSEYYVWQNDYGSLSVSDSENGHYASNLLGIFKSYDEACEFASNYIEDQNAIITLEKETKCQEK